jgi:hypothetical protein
MPLHTLLSSTAYLLSYLRTLSSKFFAPNFFSIASLLFVCFSLPTLSLAQQAPQLLGWRVIAGGGSYTDSGGNQWNAEQPYSQGSSGYVGGRTYSNANSIANTTDDPLYQSERYGNFSYKFDVPDGLYNVALHFAEIYWKNPGERIFDVFIEGSRVLDRYDICAAVGCNTALTLTFPGVQVKDGQLNIDFVTVKDNAKVSAISITSSVSAPPPPPPPASPSYTQRVNIGGVGYTDAERNHWSADQAHKPGSWGYIGGTTYSNGNSIANTTDDPLYQSERYGNFSYKFDVPNGLYNVALHFAEIYWKNPGQRIFDVVIEGSRVIDRYDICAAAGCSTALALTFPAVPVRDGQLNIDFVTVKDNAKVSAISITSSVSAPPPPPPSVSLISPTAGTTFSPGQAVIATGSGQNLRWDIDRINDGLPSFVTGQGSSITFTVPADSNSSQIIRIALTGDGGTATRDYNIVVLPSPPPTSSVRKYDIFERSVTNANNYTNKFDFNVIELRTSFTSPSGKTYSFFGFYDGDGQGGQNGNVWKFRFMPDETGTWTYSWSWTDGTTGGSDSFSVFDDGALPGPLRIASDSSWYFMNSRNQPFHFRGYDLHNFLYWMPTAEMRNEIGNFKSVLQDAINKGYNFHMWDMMADRLNTSEQYPGDAADSGWLNTTDTKRFNIPVWYAYEDALRMAKDNKVYVIPFTGMIWQGAQYNFTDFKVLLRYFVARFAPFYNFLGWSPTWETTDIWSAGETDQIMRYVYSIDPWKRLLTVHDCSHSQHKGWLSFSMRQKTSRGLLAGNSRFAGVQGGDCDGVGGIGAPFVDLPIIGSEDIWETTPEFAQLYDPTGWIMPRDADETRRGAWGIMMAGVMPLYSEWHAWAPLPGGNGQGEPEVRRMFDFFYSKTNYRRYQKLNGLVSSSVRQIASGIPGQEYLVYDEDGGSITIDLSAASGSFSVLWYDPKSGAQQGGGSVNGGASRTLTSPFSGDSVLLLSR